MTDFSSLLERFPNARYRPAWAAFCSSMQGRRYGGEALEEAWGWFSAGYEAHAAGK